MTNLFSRAAQAERSAEPPEKEVPAKRGRAGRGGLAGFGAIALSVALLAPLGPAVDAPAASAASVAPVASPQLIVNGNFSAGKAGWKVNRAKKHLFTVSKSGRSRTPAARIVVKDRHTTILGDAKSVVGYTSARTKYEVVAWVRTSRPVTAQIRVTERNRRAANAYTTKSVKLTNNSWRKIAMTATAKRSGGTLDFEVRFAASKVAKRVYVDDVSFRAKEASPDRVPEVSRPTNPGPVGSCTRPAPPKRTQFGTSISTTSTIWAADALRDRDEKFGKIAAVRIWDEPMPFSWADQRTAHLKGRTLVMSFRPKPSEVLSGKYDAELRKWFQEAPSTSTIYWSYVHEPETPIDDQRTFTADEYRRAWQHIDRIADSVCRPNMYSTLILMGWTANPASKKDWRKYYAGDDVIDVLAFDPYNGVHEPKRDYYASAEDMMSNAVAVGKAAGKPWAIAEIGSRLIPSDPTGTKRAAWLGDVATYARANGALFVTYFQSSRDGEWRLLDRPSQDAWRAAVASSR